MTVLGVSNPAPQSFDHFGRSRVDMGEPTGDGVGDLAIGVVQQNNVNGNGAGAVMFCSGAEFTSF